jgi:hypothetical protein
MDNLLLVFSVTGEEIGSSSENRFQPPSGHHILPYLIDKTLIEPVLLSFGQVEKFNAKTILGNRDHLGLQGARYFLVLLPIKNKDESHLLILGQDLHCALYCTSAG